MSAARLDDKTLNDPCDLSFSSLAEDNSQTSISSVTTNASSVSDHKVNFTAKTFLSILLHNTLVRCPVLFICNADYVSIMNSKIIKCISRNCICKRDKVINSYL